MDILGVNVERAVRHGLELVCVQIVSDSKQYTPIHTGALRNTTQYRMKGNLKAEIETGGGLDYAEKQYNKKDGKQLRHMGSFADGLQSIVSQYAGSLETGMTAKARYWGAWRLADEAGTLKVLGAPRWIERAWWNHKKKYQRIFASAFRPGQYK